jgi:hypothetical protein
VDFNDPVERPCATDSHPTTYNKGSPMPVPVSPVVREILTQDINLPTDEVIKKAKAKGVTAPDKSVRDTIYNIKSELKKQAAKGGAKPAPAAARATKTAVVPAPVVVPASAPALASSAPDLSSVLANVALVNKVAGACGGVDQARQVAEAVRACGSVEAFLLHLDLVVQVRSAIA